LNGAVSSRCVGCTRHILSCARIVTIIYLYRPSTSSSHTAKL
jgi:hypothetical protein